MLRSQQNPLITPADIKASKDYLKVDGVFNAGACKYNGEIILLLRVAESYAHQEEDEVLIPIMSEEGLKTVKLNKDDAQFDFSDSRVVINKATKQTQYLTSISHLRIARSADGENFVIDEKPIDIDYVPEEKWGMEDPRITEIDGTYYINYTAVSELGAATSMISTTDFINYQRHGIIFMPENKDVCIFNEKINGYYYAYNRPVPKAFGTPDIWISRSPDLLHWGNHQHVLGVSEEVSWDNGRIGGGAPAIKTDRGWLSIYHACDRENVYHLGAYLTPLDKPGEITHKTRLPILSPEMEYEKIGFFGNVVFTCGVIREGEELLVYYGAADDKIALCRFTLQEIFDLMEVYHG